VPTAILDANSIGLDSNLEPEPQEPTLAASRDELGGLRFLIVLAARWAASKSVDPQCRAELRTELQNLHTLYFEKIDAIAMRFGVQEAMDAQKEVERTVQVPRSMTPSILPDDHEKLYF
jgi:hypothetical protein